MTITDSQPLAPNVFTSAATNSRPAEVAPVPMHTTPGGPDSPATNQRPITIAVTSRGPNAAGRHGGNDAHRTAAAGVDPDPVANVGAAPNGTSLLDPALSLAADILDDIERVRVANENRIRQLTRTEADKDGEERGFGLSLDHPDVLGLGTLVFALQRLEHEATLNLQRKLRKHPLGPWVKATRGVGEKQAARLLAAIGDPYINSAKDAPRTVSALWAYCGLHVLPASQGDVDAHPEGAGRNQLPADPTGPDVHASRVGGVQHGDSHSPSDTQSGSGVAAKRRKGERANWSTKAKMRAYLIAESCIKQLGKDCRGGHHSHGTQSTIAVAATNDRGGQEEPANHLVRAAPACCCSPYRDRKSVV